ncbi:hypothetical protein HRbin26_00734 [bacterium HR26]|nr:hypothetical protein HRbin26_00734 [bacterium HR26]
MRIMRQGSGSNPMRQVPPCPLTILVLAYWPRICDCTYSPD